jgi:hydrogenase maturation protease
MNRARVLVAGVGNIFLGDDGFGVEVAQRLLRRALPPEVRVVDFGTRGLDLTYALLDGYEAVILVDAAPRGEAPGTLYVLEPERAAPGEPGAGPLVEPHGMSPEKVLRLAAAMGGQVGRLLLVGCEPTPLNEADEMQTGLSGPVGAAVDEAVVLAESLAGRLLRGEAIEARGQTINPEKEVGTCRE